MEKLFLGGFGLSFDPRLFLAIPSLHAVPLSWGFVPSQSFLAGGFLPWVTAEHPVGAVRGCWQSIPPARRCCRQGSLQPTSGARGLQH